MELFYARTAKYERTKFRRANAIICCANGLTVAAQSKIIYSMLFFKKRMGRRSAQREINTNKMREATRPAFIVEQLLFCCFSSKESSGYGAAPHLSLAELDYWHSCCLYIVRSAYGCGYGSVMQRFGVGFALVRKLLHNLYERV